ncbi:phage/plasmid primase, P4 family [Nitrosopumilus sp.]|uniref:phage/plasmid primase, P4 family n=1 Tax=Nitrosopumilus sp. TaxID=2024843 RepID=UPI002930F6FC|nr:phage/plasmid primase, P4 family [Nitrosopumilus sp.]
MSDITIKEIYKKQGINIVPIPKGSGKALNIKTGWSKYQYEIFTGDIPDDHDFAVILGKISGNLIVLDFDNCDDINEINMMKENVLNKTLVVRTGDGYHVYFKINELPKQANTFFSKGPYSMEVKSNGAYVVGASSNHYDKDESGNYVLTGKKYTVISNTTTICDVNATGQQLIEKLKNNGWIPKNQTNGNGHHIIIPTSELEKGNWSSGERYNNGFKLALRRFHMNWEYEEILNEAIKINNSCKPPHGNVEVERWVNDAHSQFQKNLQDPEQKYFGPATIENNNNGDKKEKKNPKDLIEITASTIQKTHSFKCLRDSDELLWYDGKIYLPNVAEPLIKEECEKWIENCCTSERYEVINKIKAINYENRENFDSDPGIITTENCILNLKTLETQEHSPLNLSCVMLPVSYHPLDVKRIDVDFITSYLKDTLFLKYLTSCFTINGKLDREQFFTVLEIMACCIVKKQFDKAFMFIGSGSNGKSVMLDYIESLLGAENVSNITIHDIELERFSKAELFGKMANVFADIESNELKKTGNLKIIISGDSITAEKKHRHPFKFRPYTKLIFSANRFPYVHDQSDGFFRRFVIVEWKRQFLDEEKNPNLREDLIKNKEEKDKVFSLLVLIARNLQQRGRFKYEESIERLRDQWNQHSDPIIQFINEVVIEKEGSMVSKREVYSRYCDFCIENEIPLVTIKKFGMIFGEYYETDQRKDTSGINKKFWIDIELKKQHIQGRLKDFDD